MKREDWRRVSWVDRPLAKAIWRNKEGGMGMQTAPHTQPVKKKRTNKLVLGFAAVVASAVVGTTGFVAATGMGASSDKPTKEQCAAAGFKNYGQCVKEWAHQKNHPGGGYGGGNGGTSGSTNTNVTANVGVTVNGNNNVISVIVNLFR